MRVTFPKELVAEEVVPTELEIPDSFSSSPADGIAAALRGLPLRPVGPVSDEPSFIEALSDQFVKIS